jgi:hypothetical protein
MESAKDWIAFKSIWESMDHRGIAQTKDLCLVIGGMEKKQHVTSKTRVLSRFKVLSEK